MISQDKQRRFEEDLIDSYDEELEMEVDDRILDGEGAFSAEAREQRKTYFRELFRLKVNSSSCRTGLLPAATGWW